MNVPTPASLKKISDEKRASASTPPADPKQSSGKSRAASGNTGRGPRKASEAKTNSSTPSKDGAEKKPFVLPEKLTDRPLKEHEGLKALRSSLQKPRTSSSGQKSRSAASSRRGKPSSSSNSKKVTASSGSTTAKVATGKSNAPKKPRTRNSPSRDAQKATPAISQGTAEGIRNGELTEEERQLLKMKINAVNSPKFDPDLAVSRYPEGTVVDLSSTHPPMPYPESKNSLKKLAQNADYGKKENDQ